MILGKRNSFLVPGQNIQSVQIKKVGRQLGPWVGKWPRLANWTEQKGLYKMLGEKDFFFSFYRTTKIPGHISKLRGNSLRLRLKISCFKSIFISPYDSPVKQNKTNKNHMPPSTLEWHASSFPPCPPSGGGEVCPLRLHLGSSPRFWTNRKTSQMIQRTKTIRKLLMDLNTLN